MEGFLIHTWLFPTQQASLLPEIYSIVKFSPENSRGGNTHKICLFSSQAERCLLLPQSAPGACFGAEGVGVTCMRKMLLQCSQCCSVTASTTGTWSHPRVFLLFLLARCVSSSPPLKATKLPGLLTRSSQINESAPLLLLSPSSSFPSASWRSWDSSLVHVSAAFGVDQGSSRGSGTAPRLKHDLHWLRDVCVFLFLNLTLFWGCVCADMGYHPTRFLSGHWNGGLSAFQC